MPDDRGVRTNEALTDQGWVRRYLADEHRAREAVETYTAAGFEVHLQSLQPEDFGDGCQTCAAGVCTAYTVVYTRRKAEEAP